ncbi:uncharacterized protein LOC129737458 isoform X9 [Falco cherrug]|uniref:uncharacterized protein LOC129737458 isoform X9 n=1 Tax=Falco cherrug TaxID=345164 RepID=UPI00247A9C48|nr:uncharacterized protein LOC129737458 isoform X9 [Falco cherrug]
MLSPVYKACITTVMRPSMKVEIFCRDQATGVIPELKTACVLAEEYLDREFSYLREVFVSVARNPQSSKFTCHLVAECMLYLQPKGEGSTQRSAFLPERGQYPRATKEFPGADFTIMPVIKPNVPRLEMSMF